MTEQTYSYNDYLANLPDERKEAVERVWQVVRENIAEDYTERISRKLLTFMAEDEMCIALANQKNYISLHLVPMYIFPELKAKLDASGKKLKGGKGCVNFRRAEELPLDIIGEIVGTYDAKTYKDQMRQIRNGKQSKKSAKDEG